MKASSALRWRNTICSATLLGRTISPLKDWLKLSAAGRGKAIFVEATCANCHRHGGIGTEVGPDLSTLTDKSPETLLVAVIDPNRAFFQRFVEYTAVTTDGLIKLGLLSEETSSSITLVDTAGKSHVVLRTDLDELVSMNRSHMPEGLEASYAWIRDVLLSGLRELGLEVKPSRGVPGADRSPLCFAASTGTIRDRPGIVA